MARHGILTFELKASTTLCDLRNRMLQYTKMFEEFWLCFEYNLYFL